MHIPQNFLPKSRQKVLRSAPGQSFPAVAVMPLAAKVLKKVMVNTGRKTERNVWRWSPACWLLFRRLTLPPVMWRL
ncbi:hypothetical protein [Escherichia coli]|uniref:hypothetical protein n=1 Tax=Escherichia coli TaxID=562 RepID=UPI003D81980F